MRRLASVFGLAFLATLLLSPAHASLRLCNRTSYVIYAAAGSLATPNITVEGWTRIAPGACEEAVKGDLTAQGYYLYARSSLAHSGTRRAWDGPINLCVKDSTFTWRLTFGARCPADGYELPFAQVETHHMRTWTTTFRESPDLPSMAAAERAGLKRLLADAGAKNLSGDKQVDGALTDFKKRMRLAANMPAAALFSALETEAMKSAVPIGYTVCNDTAKPFFAAVAQKNGAVFKSRGWWTVTAGSCSQLITDSVAGGPVWLRVERDKGVPLVSGPMRFCVTNIAFEIQGRDNCARRGLAESGFLETNAAGMPGFAAHVAGNGLIGR